MRCPNCGHALTELKAERKKRHKTEKLVNGEWVAVGTYWNADERYEDYKRMKEDDPDAKYQFCEAGPFNPGWE